MENILDELQYFNKAREELKKLREENKRQEREERKKMREEREKEMRNTLIKIYTKVLQNDLIKTQIHQILTGEEYILANDALEKLKKTVNELYNNIILNKTKKYKVDDIMLASDLLKHYSALNILVRLMCNKKHELEICHKVGENTLLTILFDLNNHIRYLLQLLIELN